MLYNRIVSSLLTSFLEKFLSVARFPLLIVILGAALSFTGCVSNDLPYPVVVPNVVSVIVDEAEKVDVDYGKREITVHLPETADIRNVNIRSVHLDHEVAFLPFDITGLHDLSKPIRFIIRTYQDYEWTIHAVRHIKREFTVQGQIGATFFDEVNRRAIAMIGRKGDLTHVTVTSLKLGADGFTEYSRSVDRMTNFTSPVSVDVTEFGYTETWNLFVEKTDLAIGVQSVDPWAHSAYVTTIGESGVENSVKFRKFGISAWTDVPQSQISSNGGSFVAHLTGLEPETEYEVVAVSGADWSEVERFVTEAAAPLPNGDFEHVSLVDGASYYKFYDPSCGVDEGSYMFWGSGNGEGSEGVNGSASMGIVITYVDTQEKVSGTQSVLAQSSQLAGILAAGNLFTGQFAGLVGTSGGKVNFGRPWETRPLALKLYCKYQTSHIDIIGGTPPGVSLSSDDYDSAQIKFALGTWDYRTYGGTPASPVHVDTTDPDTFVDFATDESTLAYGNLLIHHDGYVINGEDKVSATTSAWLEYTIPLDYQSVDVQPTHIIISCAASRYGDYFTGCSTSRLWIDAVELIYM